MRLRKAIDFSTDVACSVMGRRNVVRASRLVLRRATRDIPNDMNYNGESCLQRWVTTLSAPGSQLGVIDVGANIGLWSRSMLEVADQAGRGADLDLHAFEPSAWTFSQLSDALGGRQFVTLQHMALSERSGSAVLHVVGQGAGTNSMCEPIVARSAVAAEQIATVSLSEYADKCGLREIALVKIDTEGHDMSVMRGAQDLICNRKIAVIQFEYNWRWIESRSFLYDAFALFEPAGYQLGKLTVKGVEFYPSWDPDLETFVEGNYIAAAPDVADRLPAVRWWKL